MRLRLLVLLSVVAALALPAAAHAAADTTTTGVTCTPASPATATAVSCLVTVTDTASSGADSPSGTVAVSAVEQVGGGIDAGQCTLAANADGVSASCTVPVTPTEGGPDNVSAQYHGDGVNWGASNGTTTIDALDPTTLGLSCSPATVVVGDGAQCVATVTDTTGDADITGTVSFTVSPSSGGAFSQPGACAMQVVGTGATGSCPINFTPSAAGTYAISASYAGDNAHQGSSSSPFTVTATTTPAATSGDLGAGSLASGTSGGTSAASSQLWTVTLGPSARVTAKGVAGVVLSCAGPVGSTCSGTLELSTLGAAKKVKKVKKTTSKKKKKKKTKATKTTRELPVRADAKRRKPVKPKPAPPPRPTIVFGSAGYSLSAGSSATISVHLSKKGFALLKADKGRITVTGVAEVEPVSAAGPVKLTLAGKVKPKQHPKKKKKKRKKK